MEFAQPSHFALAPRTCRHVLLDEHPLLAFERAVDKPRQKDIGDLVGRRVDLEDAAAHSTTLRALRFGVIRAWERPCALMPTPALSSWLFIEAVNRFRPAIFRRPRPRPAGRRRPCGRHRPSKTPARRPAAVRRARSRARARQRRSAREAADRSPAAGSRRALRLPCARQSRYGPSPPSRRPR